MDWSTVIVGALSLIGTLVGSYSGMRLMSYRIEQLERKVDKHTSLTEEIPVIKEHLRTLDKRVDDLEDKVG